MLERKVKIGHVRSYSNVKILLVCFYKEFKDGRVEFNLYPCGLKTRFQHR